VQQLVDEASLDAAFAAPLFLLLKHSPICPISNGVRLEVEAFVGDHPDLQVGVVDVVGERTVSNAVAARTGIQHESPQALLLKAGAVVWHENHWRITAARLTEALAAMDA
jgi:bacillithiol system protein YtxJ